MAKLSEHLKTPSWLRVEVSTDHYNMTHTVRVGVDCRDGFAHVLTLDVERFSFATSADESREQILRQAHEFITKQLAILELEKT